jgi:uncharacterized membrane-anchored protein YhcB (DUF1043 family)
MIALVGIIVLLVVAYFLAKTLGHEHEAMDEITDLSDQYETYYAELGLDKQFRKSDHGMEDMSDEHHDFMGLTQEEMEEY